MIIGTQGSRLILNLRQHSLRKNVNATWKETIELDSMAFHVAGSSRSGTTDAEANSPLKSNGSRQDYIATSPIERTDVPRPASRVSCTAPDDKPEVDHIVSMTPMWFDRDPRLVSSDEEISMWAGGEVETGGNRAVEGEHRFAESEIRFALPEVGRKQRRRGVIL